MLGYLLAGCQGGNPNQTTLNARVLKHAIPPQLVGEFRQTRGQTVNLKFSPESRLSDLFARLQIWQRQAARGKAEQSGNPLSFLPFLGSRSPAVADLVMLGDYWLQGAIAQGIVQPLSRSPNWSQLSPAPIAWESLMRRDGEGRLDPEGKIWGAPYRWGCSAIAYRADKFKSLGWTPTDWSDLWRDEIARRISVLDSPRETIGLTLKKLGRSYNEPDLDSISELDGELERLQQQVRLYSSTHYLQPLILGDTWLAVGWSSDILPLLEYDRRIKAIVPRSGTSLWSDVWVRPASAAKSDPELLTAWMEFGWQPNIARQLSILTQAASPAISGSERSQLPPKLRDNPILLPDRAILKNSEFLQPLSEKAIGQYRSRWLTMRQTGSS